MKNFDLYEYTALILPGAIVLYGLALLYPELKLVVQNKDFTVGDLGLFVILSYAGGHIIQGFGNLIEWVWWKLEGKPTDWVRTHKENLLSDLQLAKLGKMIPQKLGLQIANLKISKELKEQDWFAITRQVYATVSAAKRSERVDIFNANYGLCRGLTCSLLILSVTAFVKLGIKSWAIPSLLFILSLILFLRMRRFGKHYARELFIQFLQLPKT